MIASRFEREYGCTEADWLRWLPPAVAPHELRLAPAGAARVDTAAGHLRLSWTVLPPLLVSSIAYCCSGAWSYLGHYHITFRADTAHRTSIAKFIVLFGSGYAVSSGIVLLGEVLALPRDVATAAAMPLKSPSSIATPGA